MPLFENKIDLLGRTDEFGKWMKEREERVIVGELLILCCEMRVISKPLFLLTIFLVSCQTETPCSVVLIYSKVSSHATWLHSIRNSSLSYEKEESREMFKKGQMLAVYGSTKRSVDSRGD